MITVEKLISMPSFLALATSDALELLAEKSKHSYDELFLMFMAGHKELTDQVVELVAFAALVTVDGINGGSTHE